MDYYWDSVPDWIIIGTVYLIVLLLGQCNWLDYYWDSVPGWISIGTVYLVILLMGQCTWLDTERVDRLSMKCASVPPLDQLAWTASILSNRNIFTG